jgi:peptidoglycan/xylan/chitin deacetylase (PgdA/CDA1 family)
MARALLHKAGWLRGVRYMNQKGIRILMYHDFPASTPGLQEALAKQCAYINRYYQVVTLTDIARLLQEGTPLPPNAVAVTVDDGNRDFLLRGYPVFHKHRIPVTVFLVSGFLDHELWLWWDQVRYMVDRSKRPSIQISFMKSLPPINFPLETAAQRESAIFTITEVMKEVGNPIRVDILNRLPGLLEVELPREAPPEMAAMEWPEVRHLAENGVDFGAHTVTHPVLSRIGDDAILLEEIEYSKRRIEKELHRPVLHFGYPYGRAEDFNEQTIKIVKQSQFLTAVTSVRGMNYRDAPPFTLKRLGLDPTMPELYFKELLAGLHVS